MSSEAFNQFSIQAALDGITVNFSSGDAGDEIAGTDLASKTVDFPAGPALRHRRSAAPASSSAATASGWARWLGDRRNRR